VDSATHAYKHVVEDLEKTAKGLKARGCCRWELISFFLSSDMLKPAQHERPGLGFCGLGLPGRLDHRFAVA
jgi:hypothetical protein